MQHADVVRRAERALGGRCVGRFGGLPHAPVEAFEEAVAMAREVQPEALVSIGGGSSHDTAKGVATVLGEGGADPRLRDAARAAGQGGVS